jgi:multidrug transporter EmrE-like cation transporter
MFKNIRILWLILSALFSALTILVIKHYSVDKNIGLLAIAFISEMLLIYSYLQLVKNTNVLVDFALVKIIAILFVWLVSVCIFENKLSAKQIIGVLLSIIVLYLLQ